MAVCLSSEQGKILIPLGLALLAPDFIDYSDRDRPPDRCAPTV